MPWIHKVVPIFQLSNESFIYVNMFITYFNKSCGIRSGTGVYEHGVGSKLRRLMNENLELPARFRRLHFLSGHSVKRVIARDICSRLANCTQLHLGPARVRDQLERYNFSLVTVAGLRIWKLTSETKKCEFGDNKNVYVTAELMKKRVYYTISQVR